MRIKKIFILLLPIVVLAGCFLSNKISNQNLSYIYKSNLSLMHPEFLVYNFSEDSTRLFFKVNTDELLFTKQEEIGRAHV